MEKLFLKNTSYICIHYAPSTSLVEAIENLYNGLNDKNQFVLHHQFHITLLYAPINTRCYQEAVNCIRESNHPEFQTHLTFATPQKTQYGTIQLPVEPSEPLKMLHRYFYSILKPYIHNFFINAYDSCCNDHNDLDFIHTSNIGENYFPHMTVGYIQDGISNSDIDLNLGPILTTASDVEGVFLSEANDYILKPILSLSR